MTRIRLVKHLLIRTPQWGHWISGRCVLYLLGGEDLQALYGNLQSQQQYRSSQVLVNTYRSLIRYYLMQGMVAYHWLVGKDLL